MDDPHDLDLEHQRRLRAERVLTMLRELWGDELPPGPNAEVAVLIDTIALDDDHGAGDQLITQRDGLTYAMVAELITHYHPDTANPPPPATLTKVAVPSPRTHHSSGSTPSPRPTPPRPPTLPHHQHHHHRPCHRRHRRTCPRSRCPRGWKPG